MAPWQEDPLIEPRIYVRYPTVSSRATLICAFLALGFLGGFRVRSVTVLTQRISDLRRGTPPPEPGSFPSDWIHGADCNRDPIFQVHEYNANTWILRQSKCSTGEGPFLYLLFGDERALLLDTGANPDDDVHGWVLGVVDTWLERNERDSIPLIVAHTHSHIDHISGDSQFVGQANVEHLVGLSQAEVEAFWGFESFPVDAQTIDLGGRVIDVLGTPGHQAQSLSFYDRNTHLLLAGDIVYPGHLFVFTPAEWSDFVDSLQRMVDFASENPVEWVVGCHIEYKDVPDEPYPWSQTFTPNEAPLQLAPSVLPDVLAAAKGMHDEPQCQIFPQFVIHPVYLCGIMWNGDDA